MTDVRPPERPVLPAASGRGKGPRSCPPSTDFKMASGAVEGGGQNVGRSHPVAAVSARLGVHVEDIYRGELR